MRICCFHDVFNGTVGLSLSQVLLESVSEDGQLSAFQLGFEDAVFRCEVFIAQQELLVDRPGSILLLREMLPPTGAGL